MSEQKYKILIVDDVDINLVILSEIIESMGHIPLTALCAKDAVEVLKKEVPHLILLDNSMPDISGLEFCTMLKNDVYTRNIPIIFISALDSADDLSKAFEAGAVDYIYKPFEPVNVKMRINTHLKLFSIQSELEVANRRLNGIIKKQLDQSKNKQIEFYSTIAQLISERDSKRTFNCKYTEGQMVRILAQAMQLSPDYEERITDVFLEDIERAAILHDIGLIKVPDAVALKCGPLTAEEQHILEMHTVYGSEKLEMFESKFEDNYGEMFRDIVLYHHENYDGSGFPKKLAGEEIPLAARIMRVVDMYEACVNDRCYHKARTHEETVEMIKSESGRLFDPKIVNIFVKIQKRFI